MSRDDLKRLREARRLAGLCVECAKPHRTKYKSCDECRKATAKADGAKRGIQRGHDAVIVDAKTFRFTPLAERLIAEKDVSLAMRFLRRRT